MEDAPYAEFISHAVPLTIGGGSISGSSSGFCKSSGRSSAAPFHVKELLL